MTNLHEAAHDAHANGLCVIPAATNGTKQPWPDGPSWKRYQSERPTLAQLDRWFAENAHGLGIVTGAVSGNLELFEFEGRAIAEGVARELAEIADASGLGDLWRRVILGYSERTPTGGIHILYHVDGDVAGNTKLAQRPSTPDELAAWKAEQQASINTEQDSDRRVKRQEALDRVTRGEQLPQVLIETRGEGGFVVTAPSSGRTHPTGGSWTMVTGGFSTIATVTPEERDALHHLAGALDQMPATEQATPPVTPPAAPGFRQPGRADDGQLRPGDDFNARAVWDDIIGVHGWTRLYTNSRGVTYWRRPGKNIGISASTGRNGADNFYAWTTSTEFEAERPYDKFGAYTLLTQGSTGPAALSAAGKALRTQGYGSEPERYNPGDLIAPSIGTDGNLATIRQLHSAPVVDDARPRIDITHEDAALLAISDALNARKIPGLYIHNGEPSQVHEINDGSETRLLIPALTPDALRMLLARHTACYKLKLVKDDLKVISALPNVAAAKAVLSQSEWPGLPILAGVITTPIIRPDGSVLTTAGYDPATRLYHRPTIDVSAVPEHPAPEEVAQALKFVLEYVLADFCFDSEASRSNYFAMLVTPLLRLYVNGSRPLGVVSATTRGAGKSLLTEILKALYGMRMNPWISRDEEMAKTITSLLRDTTDPVICFDNVGTFDTVSHPSLSMLLTAREWSSRILGVNNMISSVNDRVWFVTGNNVNVGGDNASRSVLIRLDPQMERPELRTGFAIGDLWSWLDHPANRATLFRALLVLVRAWVAAGAPQRTDLQMRNFSKWAQMVGGFVNFYGLPDFLANAEELSNEGDEEETSTAAFLARWHAKFGTARKKGAELVESSRGQMLNGQWIDTWDGTFPTKADGTVVSAKGLGKYLSSRRGRIFAGIRLQGAIDPHSKVWLYHVENVADGHAGDST
ncbi:bifunctional DNA primase/polymerase [Streptosporangium sp. G12]